MIRKGTLLLIILFFFSATLLGQQKEQPKQPAKEQPKQPAKEQPKQPAKPKEDPNMIHLNFSGSALKEVIKMFENLTENKFLFDEATISGKTVNLIASTPIPRTSVFSIFQSILEVQGLALVPAGAADPKLYKIIPVKDASKKPTPMLQEWHLEMIPANDRLITFVYELKFARADDVIKTIQPLVSIPDGIGGIQGTNIIRITDRANNIKRIAQFLKFIDKKGETPGRELVKLENVHPDNLVQEIQPIIELENQQQMFRLQSFITGRMTSMFSRARGGFGGGGAQTQQNDSPPNYVPISVSSVARLRSVLISGPSSLLPAIKSIITKLDVKDPGDNVLVTYPVRYGNVTEVATALSNIFGIELPSGSTSTSSQSTPNPMTRGFFGGGRGGQGGRGGRGGRGGMMGGRGGMMGAMMGGTAPAATRTSGKAKMEKNSLILPDQSRNAIMVMAPPTVQTEIKKVLENIDVPGPQDNVLQYYLVRYTDLNETASILGTIFGIKVQLPAQPTTTSSTNSSTTNTTNYTLRFTTERVIIPDENLKKLIVVAPRIVQVQVEATLNQIDVIGPRENQLHFYELEDARKVYGVANTLSQIYNIKVGVSTTSTTTSSSSLSSRGGMGGRGGMGSMGGLGSSTTNRNYSTKKFGVEEIIIPDEEMGVVLVSAPKEIHEGISTFVNKINRFSRQERLTVRFYKLENTNSEDIAGQISKLFNIVLGDKATTGTSSTSSTNRNTGTTNRTSTLGTSSSSSSSNRLRSSTGSSSMSPRSSGGGFAPPEGGAPQSIADTEKTNRSGESSSIIRKASYLYQGDPRVLSNPNTNSVIVIAPGTLHEEISSLVKKLDRRRPQVMFEVAILDVSSGDDKRFAIELGTVSHPADKRIRFQGLSNFGNSGFSDTANPGGFPDGRNITPTTGAIMGLVKDTASNIPILLKALQSTNKVNIRSTPLILVNDNETAEFRSIREEPTTTTVTGTATTNVVFSGFVDAGTSLTITPHISEGNYIRVEIILQVDNFVGAPQAPGIPPSKNSNYLKTTITVPDSNTVIIGGLETSSVREAEDKIPILGDIPLLGNLFKSTRTEKTKAKLYLFIRPRILTHVHFEDLKGISLKKVNEVFKKGEKNDLTGPLSDEKMRK